MPSTFGYLLSQIRLSVVCYVHALYSGSETFRQYFFATVHLSHPLASVQNFTEIVTLPSGALNARGVTKQSSGGPVEGYIL